MTEIAKEPGLGGEILCKTFALGAIPRCEAVQKVLHSLRVKISVSAA